MLVGIFGAGRNGSTLLMRLLDGSPGLWIYPIELNYLTMFDPQTWRARVRRVSERGKSILLKQAVSHSVTRSHEILLNWAKAQIQELQQTYVDKLSDPLQARCEPLEVLKRRAGSAVNQDLRTYLEVIQACYDDRALSQPPHLMFKSIEVPELPRYQRLFPDMKFVHIVRHPYSNYTSLKRTDMVLKQKPFWYQGGDILRLQLESRWIPHVRFALQGLKENPDRHHLVRYEDLCESPEQAVSGICNWLGVEPPKEPALQTVLGGKHLKTLPKNSSLKGVDTPARVVSDMAKEYGYDDILTERERKLILLRTYQFGRQLGYFSAQDEAQVPARFRLFLDWVAPDQWEYMNASSRIRLVRALVERRLYLCRVLLAPPA